MLEVKIHQLNEFYQRWNTKSESYDSEELSTVFDKFFTLFVIFNRMYNVVLAILCDEAELETLRANGKIDKRRKVPYENQVAIFCVAHYLREISDEVVAELNDEINSFKSIIEEKRFNIDLYYGNPQPKKDKKILEDLRSDNSIQILEGVLKILYNVRCNIFHAEKGYNPDQRIILNPCNDSLDFMNRKLIELINSKEQELH